MSTYNSRVIGVALNGIEDSYQTMVSLNLLHWSTFYMIDIYIYLNNIKTIWVSNIYNFSILQKFFLIVTESNKDKKQVSKAL